MTAHRKPGFLFRVERNSPTGNAYGHLLGSYGACEAAQPACTRLTANIATDDVRLGFAGKLAGEQSPLLFRFERPGAAAIEESFTWSAGGQYYQKNDAAITALLVAAVDGPCRVTWRTP